MWVEIHTRLDEFETLTELEFKDRNDIFFEFGDRDNTPPQVRRGMAFTPVSPPLRAAIKHASRKSAMEFAYLRRPTPAAADDVETGRLPLPLSP